MILATKTQQAFFSLIRRVFTAQAYIILHYSIAGLTDGRCEAGALRGKSDTVEQEVRLQSRMLRTIFRGKESATEKIPPILGKGEMVR